MPLLMYVRFLLLLSVPTVVLREPNFAAWRVGRKGVDGDVQRLLTGLGRVRGGAPRLVRQQGWPGGVQYGSPDGV